MPASTRVVESFYHTPTEAAHALFTVVLRAGHLQAGPEYGIARRICAGHDLLLCVSGGGFIQAGGKTYPVSPGELAWLNGHHPHAHWAHSGDPWDLLWARLDGHSLNGIYEVLRVPDSPVFKLLDRRRTEDILRRILRLLRERPCALEALVHAEASALIACLFEARQTELAASLGSGPGLPAKLRKTLTDLSLYYYRQWRVQDLADAAGMSVPHFFRCFQKATGATPISFLRRERINQAKRRLIESSDSIKEIAEQVGYSDQFYFSRDFKRYTGMSPTGFRRRELGLETVSPTIPNATVPERFERPDRGADTIT